MVKMLEAKTLYRLTGEYDPETEGDKEPAPRILAGGTRQSLESGITVMCGTLQRELSEYGLDKIPGWGRIKGNEFRAEDVESVYDFMEKVWERRVTEINTLRIEWDKLSNNPNWNEASNTAYAGVMEGLVGSLAYSRETVEDFVAWFERTR